MDPLAFHFGVCSVLIYKKIVSFIPKGINHTKLEIGLVVIREDLIGCPLKYRSFLFKVSINKIMIDTS